MPVRRLLVRVGDLKNHGLVISRSNDLQSDWQSISGESARQRQCRRAEVVEGGSVAGRPAVGFVDRLGNQGSRFSHSGEHQNVHLLEDPPNIAAAFTDALQRLDIGAASKRRTR